MTSNKGIFSKNIPTNLAEIVGDVEKPSIIGPEQPAGTEGTMFTSCSCQTMHTSCSCQTMHTTCSCRSEIEIIEQAELNKPFRIP